MYTKGSLAAAPCVVRAALGGPIREGWKARQVPQGKEARKLRLLWL